MRVQIKNLGVIREADFEVGDLTIICGGNNTGKTYVNYALYGFLDFWWNVVTPGRMEMKEEINAAFERRFRKKNAIVAEVTEAYINVLPVVFASSDKFAASSFSVDVSADNDTGMEDTKEELPPPGAKQSEHAIKGSFFDFLPNPFVITAERSGILNLWGELDMPDDPWNPANRHQGESTVPLPIQRNIDFVRMSKNGRFRTEGPLANGFLGDLENLFGGTYNVHGSTIYFLPKESNAVQLRMPESSSSVRALFLLNYYLRYIAQKGDILMIDEPELNLHPEQQRLIARLLARLVNAGIKVFLTTHSDYLIRELNILIMLNRKEERLERIRNEEGYKENELLDAGQVRVYTAEKTKEGDGYMLYPADIHQARGIEVCTFDTTIDRTNVILEDIVYGHHNDRLRK